MMTLSSKTVPVAAVVMAGAGRAAEINSVRDLIARVKDPDDKVRGPAWQDAARFGAQAVGPLAELMSDPEMEVARAAKRAIWKIARHAGRPGAEPEKQLVAAELVPLLSRGEPKLRREFVWMLSEIGGDDAIEPLTKLLAEPELREDARAALQRIPGRKSLAALKSALKTAPEDYKPAVAVSLRVRGERVRGYPSQKLVPTKQTTVKPLVKA